MCFWQYKKGVISLILNYVTCYIAANGVSYDIKSFLILFWKEVLGEIMVANSKGNHDKFLQFKNTTFCR